ncbi:MAG: stalk domain-containing protein, partial [Clostridia bacterium]|nr:stalk domain-containing protein [Clostridia bacterium]
SKPEKPEKPQKPSNHEKPQKPAADNTPEIDGDTTVSPRPEKPQKPEKPTETLDPNASPRPEKPHKPEKPDATIDPSATADPDAEPSDEVADEEKSEISKDEFKKKKEERRNAHIEAKEYIKELKPLFKDADSETRKEILSEIAEAKKDLQEYSIGVFVRGIDLDFGKYNNVTPYIKNDLTLIPLRAVAESLDADVSWDDETRTITITKNDTTIVMQVDSQTALINGEEYELAAVPEINNGRTMVPLRFIMEAMKSTVEWDDESRTVIIE